MELKDLYLPPMLVPKACAQAVLAELKIPLARVVAREAGHLLNEMACPVYLSKKSPSNRNPIEARRISFLEFPENLALIKGGRPKASA